MTFYTIFTIRYAQRFTGTAWKQVAILANRGSKQNKMILR